MDGGAFVRCSTRCFGSAQASERPQREPRDESCPDPEGDQGLRRLSRHEPARRFQDRCQRIGTRDGVNPAAEEIEREVANAVAEVREERRQGPDGESDAPPQTV